MSAIFSIAGVDLTLLNAGVVIGLFTTAALAVLIPVMKGAAVSKESEELDRAAAAYVESQRRGGDPDRTHTRFREEVVEISAPLGLGAKIPKRLLGENTLLLVFICAVTYFGYQHHLASEEGLRKIYEATVENTYVLSLPQSEREKLNISIPDSLRRKMRRTE